jgi:N-sulfoglucosamine sulfohydrolase
MLPPITPPITAVMLIVFSVITAAEATAAEQPNILWISAEDISAGTCGCYGGPARTPRIDALATGGLRFDAAFSAAPVCAPSRSAIISGMMPTSLGSLPMRCQATPPPFVGGFPTMLREAGYYCTNNSKTDYNFVAAFDAGWNESGNRAHWRNRPAPQQPFFAVFNLGVTHESGLFAAKIANVVRTIPPGERADPATIIVPAFYPDTPVIRAALANRLDLAAALDRDVGRILDELAADGLAESTIVVFWGDHGEGIARGKRALTEFGLRVPLVVRVPERFRGSIRLPGAAPAGVTGNLVSLLDLGPTALDIAGAAIPTWMEGRSFLGPHATTQDAVIGVADRMDAAPGFGRSVRDGRFRYLRNFLPWLDGDDLPDYASGVPITAALREARANGTLPSGAAWFARTSRPAEELTDTVADPHGIHDLAGDAAYGADLGRLRETLRDWMRRTRDTGILPEPILRREARAVGSEWAIFHPHDDPHDDADAAARYDAILAAAWDVADQPADAPWRERLASADPPVRFWAIHGIGWGATRSGGDAALQATALLRPSLADADPVVRIVAAWWLLKLGTGEPRTACEVLDQTIAATDPDVRQQALVAIDQLGDAGRPLWEAAAALDLGRDKADEYSRRTVERIRRSIERLTGGSPSR